MEAVGGEAAAEELQGWRCLVDVCFDVVVDRERKREMRGRVKGAAVLEKNGFGFELIIFIWLINGGFNLSR